MKMEGMNNEQFFVLTCLIFWLTTVGCKNCRVKSSQEHRGIIFCDVSVTNTRSYFLISVCLLVFNLRYGLVLNAALKSCTIILMRDQERRLH